MAMLLRKSTSYANRWRWSLCACLRFIALQPTRGNATPKLQLVALVPVTSLLVPPPMALVFGVFSSRSLIGGAECILQFQKRRRFSPIRCKRKTRTRYTTSYGRDLTRAAGIQCVYQWCLSLLSAVQPAARLPQRGNVYYLPAWNVHPFALAHIVWRMRRSQTVFSSNPSLESP